MRACFTSLDRIKTSLETHEEVDFHCMGRVEQLQLGERHGSPHVPVVI